MRFGPASSDTMIRNNSPGTSATEIGRHVGDSLGA
jgi:hypothetical protein